MIEALLPFLLHPAFLIAACFGTVIIGVVYFTLAFPETSLPLRVITSAYAPTFAILFLAGILLTGANLPGPKYSAFALVQIVPLVLISISLWRYPGPKWLHLILLPIALVFGLLLFGWGSVFIYGK